MEESLFLNTLAFEFPREPQIFFFSLTDKEDVPLTKLNHQLFPANIRDIFPDISNDCFLYTSFTRRLAGFKPLSINFATDNYALVKRYYNREIKHYFTHRNYLVEPTFIQDNQIWLPNNTDKAPNGCRLYDRYTIKVNFNHFTNSPELVISYDRKAKVFKKSVAAFLSEEENATADLFNRVVHVEYFENEGKKSTKKRVIKYEKLLESERAIDYNNVYPIVGSKLAAYLCFEEEEENDNPFQRVNRYTKYLSKIFGFYNNYLKNENFQKVVPISDKGFDNAKPLQIGKTTPQSKQLIFGKNNLSRNAIDVIPQRGVNNGPFNQPRYNNIQMFFITSAEHVQHTNMLSGYIKKDIKFTEGYYNIQMYLSLQPPRGIVLLLLIQTIPCRR